MLAWHLWENRNELVNKHVLEIGSGTALPGIVAAKCGAKVTLSDSATLPKSLAHIKRSCQLNNLTVNKNIKLIGLTWGLFLYNFETHGPVDIILGSDCFYDPLLFEDVVVTIAHIFDHNPGCRFLSTYHERSSDWSIEHLLAKWNLRCKVLNINTLGASVGLDVQELVGDHTIHLLEITR